MADYTILIRTFDVETGKRSEWFEFEQLIMINKINTEPHIQCRNIERQRRQWPLNPPDHLFYEWKKVD